MCVDFSAYTPVSYTSFSPVFSPNLPFTTSLNSSSSSIDASVLIEDNQCFIGSTAVLHVLLLLDGYWSFLGAVGLAVPELLRELVYGVFAKVRYQVGSSNAR